MSFQVNSLTDRVKSFIRGSLQQGPKTLSDIGNYLPQGNASTTGILGQANQNSQRIANTGVVNNFNRNLNTVKKYGVSNFYQGNFPHVYKAVEGLGEGLSFNLVDIPGYKSVTPQEKASYFGGAVGGVLANPLSKGLNPFGAADKLGGKIVSRLAPNLTGVASKIAGGVTGEAIQTAGYLGAGELGRRAGINKFRPITKENILPETAKQFAFGLALRGAFNGTGSLTNQLRGLSEKDRQVAEIYSYIKQNQKTLRELKRVSTSLPDHMARDTASEPVKQWYKEYFKLSDEVVRKTDFNEILDSAEQVFKEKFGDQGIKMGITSEAGNYANGSKAFAVLPDQIKTKSQRIFDNLDKGDLSLYGKDIAKIGGSRSSSTDQVGVLAQAHNSQTIRSLARRILDRIDDPKGLQEIKNELDNPDTYPKIGGAENIRRYKDEVNILRRTIDEIAPSSKSQLTDIYNQATKHIPDIRPDSMFGINPTGNKVPNPKTNPFGDQGMRMGITSGAGNIGQKVRVLRNVPELADQSQSTLKLKGGKTPTRQPTLRIPGSSSSNNTPAMTTIQDVEMQIYGSKTGVVPKGSKESVGFFGDNLRRLEKGASNLVSRGLESENKIIRNTAGLMQDLIGGAGKSQAQIKARAQYRGGIDYGTKVASDAQRHIYQLLNRDDKSLARVHAVLDPEISKLKVLEKDLTPQEREAVGTLRILSDFVNDTNFANGFISKKQWASNRGGKYIARAYEAFDYPPEVADFIKNKDLRFDLNPFKARGEVTDWKVENAIKDPAYLMSKRVQQTIFNGEVKKYAQWAESSGLTSEVAKPGFVQLSDSKAYGKLAGKYIRKDALEDIKGFFLTHDVGQKAYEILSWYDRNPIRRSQKMLKTVFNPAVRLGNKTGNYVFAWLSGINPATFAKNNHWAKTAIKENDPLYRYAITQGLIGTDVTKADIARISAELSREIQEPGLLKKVIKELQDSYGRVDDASKLASLKTWVDRGIDPAEAVNRTRRGFQDYNMVGFLYDVGAKLPILGNPFVRFASESLRIAKNATVDHPIRTIGTLGAWKLFTDVMSRMQGETAQDRETREQRVGASHIPFTDISTNIQTPWGETNVSRLLGFSTTFTPEDSTYTDISKYAPIQNPLDVRNYGSDPMIGPLISLGTDKDFRGKSIADPNQNKYIGSTLTAEEKNMNRAGYLARSYLPPTATDLFNVTSAMQGKPNVYGQVKSTPQALARVYPGVKVENYGPEEADAARKREAYFNTQRMESLEKKAKSVQKDLETGKITPDQAKKRNSQILKDMIPDPKFEDYKDAPKDLGGKLMLYKDAFVVDPIATINAIRTGQPIRKVDKDTVVLKRMQGLGALDFGDKNTQIDHDLPLQYGGSNYDNLLPIADNKAKTIVQGKIYKEYEQGKITKTVRDRRIANWKSEIGALTPTEKKKISSLPDGKLYDYKGRDGKTQLLSIDPPAIPKYTGNKELDKKLTSKYNGEITKAGNNIIKLYESGVLTADEASKAMDALTVIKPTKKGKKKGKTAGVKFSKVKIGKIKKSAIKFGKLPSLKRSKKSKLVLRGLTRSQKEYRIKA